MTLIGVGEILAGFIMGQAIDKWQAKATCAINVGALILALAFTILIITNNGYDISTNKLDWLAYMTCFLWGFSDGAVLTQTFTMLAFEFDSNTHPFAVYAIVVALSLLAF